VTEKTNMKKKLLAKIFIPIIALGILVAPISPAIKFENGKISFDAKVQKTTAQIQNASAADTLKLSSLEWAESSDSVAKFNVSIIGDQEEYANIMLTENWVVTSVTADNSLILAVFDKNTNSYVNHVDITKVVFDDYKANNFVPPSSINFPADVVSLTQNTQYVAKLFWGARVSFTANTADSPAGVAGAINVIPGNSNLYYNFGNSIDFSTAPTGQVISGTNTQVSGVTATTPTNMNMEELQCNIGNNVESVILGKLWAVKGINWGGCLAQITYFFWEIAEAFARLAGHILDFFVYSATNSSMYSKEFVRQAWGIIRDVANIFFIIALLYVAIKTILNLNVSNNKRIIASIVIAALLINFSFFLTNVVIDASNILAKVFYNQIQNKDGTFEQTTITEKLIDNLNPTKIVSSDVFANTDGVVTFNLVAWLCLGITLWMAWIFASVSFVFISRIISLWFCIIFSPFAFASFSFKEKISGIGHQDWLDMLLKNAFLAPIFIFFLYITVLFTELMPQALSFEYAGGSMSSFYEELLQATIPILLCLVLLQKGKSLAVKYSGEMGTGVKKAVGFATGVIGVKYVGGFLASKFGQAGRATVGRLGKAASESQTLNRTGVGRFVARLGEKASKASFDLRGSGGYQKIMGAMGVKSVGKPKGVGGFEKGQAERRAKRMAAAEKMKPKAGSKEVKDLEEEEKNLQSVLIRATGAIEKLEKQMEVAGKNANESKEEALTLRKVLKNQGKTDTEIEQDANYKKALQKEQIYRDQVKAFKEHKNAIENGVDIQNSKTEYQKIDKNGNISKHLKLSDDVEKDENNKPLKYSVEFTLNNKSISDMKRAVGEKKRVVELKHAERLGALADNLDTSLNRFMYGRKDIREDAHKIRMKEKINTGSK
jgi:hypothetical protein